MPRVLIVIARFNKGGTSRFIAELCRQLPSHGYEILVATGHVQGKEIEDPIAEELPIHRINSLGRKISLKADLKARRELRQLIEEFKPDLIYSHTFKAGLLSRTISTPIPLIHAFHGHLIDEPELSGFRVKVVMLIERLLAHRAKVLVTVGRRVAKELLANGVGKEAQYFPVAPGIRPLELKSREFARNELNLERETRPIVAWLARVVPVKGPNRVIELAKQISEARFILAGGGDLLDEIRDSAPDNLTVLGWRDARSVWAVADLAISTSMNEGMPIALIEAQMAGLPVVAISVGSVEEVVAANETGFLFEEFGDDFVSAVKRLVAEQDLRESMGTLAKERALALFSLDKFTQEHLRLFELVRKSP